jgi:hypothetical protein
MLLGPLLLGPQWIVRSLLGRQLIAPLLISPLLKTPLLKTSLLIGPEIRRLSRFNQLLAAPRGILLYQRWRAMAGRIWSRR